MTPENFCYWLQGYFEILDAKGSIHDYLSEDQLKTVKDHLKHAYAKLAITSRGQLLSRLAVVVPGVT